PQSAVGPSRSIALLSPCGWGNLGDAAIFDALIAGIRRRLPETPIIGLTLNPADTSERHGIAAFTCSGVRLPRYRVKEPVVGGRAEPSAFRGAAASVPAARALGHVARAVQADWNHRSRAAGWIENLGMLVIAGGGQLDDFWGGPFGHPYVLSRWVAAARRRAA